jgi:hypothetical protein
MSKFRFPLALLALMHPSVGFPLSVDCEPDGGTQLVDDSFLEVKRHEKWLMFGQMAIVFLPELHEGQGLSAVNLFIGLYPGSPEWSERNTPSFMATLPIQEWTDGRKFVRFTVSEKSPPVYLSMHFGGNCGHDLVYEHRLERL